MPFHNKTRESVAQCKLDFFVAENVTLTFRGFKKVLNPLWLNWRGKIIGGWVEVDRWLQNFCSSQHIILQHTRVCACVYAHMLACLCVGLCMSVCVCVYVCVCACIRLCACVWYLKHRLLLCEHRLHMCLNMYICIYVCIERFACECVCVYSHVMPISELRHTQKWGISYTHALWMNPVKESISNEIHVTVIAVYMTYVWNSPLEEPHEWHSPIHDIHDVHDVRVDEILHSHMQDSLISRVKRDVWISDSAAVIL